jgi:hypothetical protein
MANINEIITLGIGTPSDIPHLTLFGLSPTGPVAVVVVSVQIFGPHQYVVPPVTP